MTKAGVDDVMVLDRATPRHPLSKGLKVARRFEDVLQDGYDPGCIDVTPDKKAKRRCSLLDHVAKQSKYAKTQADYSHEFWKLLVKRVSDAETDQALQKLLRKQNLVRLNISDQIHGDCLGLIREIDPYAEEEPGAPPLCIYGIADDPTLDGLQLLLLLYRESQDLAQHGPMQSIGAELKRATDAFAVTHHYSGEVLDTWHLLVQTRMLRWNPGFQPSAEALKRAECELRQEREAMPKRKGKRGKSSPDSYTRGRAERRWRRQIWARAGRISVVEAREPKTCLTPYYAYVDTTLGDWLIKNRALMERLYSDAIELLMDGDPANFLKNGTNPLPHLSMPESLYRRRRRPRTDEETWRHFGDYLPFDILPVDCDQ